MGSIPRVLQILKRAIERYEEPAVEKISENTREDPFRVLIATMLSAQTKDAVTAGSMRHASPMLTSVRYIA